LQTRQTQQNLKGSRVA